MSRLATLLAGFLAAGAVVAGAALASPGAPSSTASSHQVMIVHVQRGCHSWFRAGKTSASLTLTVKRGTSLMILNLDIDAHRLVQIAGPKLRLPRAMMMNRGGSIFFSKTGLYRFATRIVEMEGEMEGMRDEVETAGPDHVLRLTVKVS